MLKGSVTVILREGFVGQHGQSEGCVGVGVRAERTPGWENWDPVVKGPVSLLHPGGGGVLESPEVTGVLLSLRRIDCFEGEGTGVRQGGGRVLLGEGERAERPGKGRMRAQMEDDGDEMTLGVTLGGELRGGEREESEIT